MFKRMSDMADNPLPERRYNPRLRTIYPVASERLHRLFKNQQAWAGSSIDFVALRAVHEQYRDLSPGEVRALVTTIGSRVRHCVSHDHLVAITA